MSRSKLAEYMNNQIVLKLGALTVKENYRPNWLWTGRGQNLEIDFYFPDLKLGIEVQGEQHFVYVPHFHKNYDGFLDQQKRDEDKAQLCKLESVSLHYVIDRLGIDLLMDNILNAIQQTTEDRSISIKLPWQVRLDWTVYKITEGVNNPMFYHNLLSLIERRGLNEIMEYDKKHMSIVIEYLRNEQDRRDRKNKAKIDNHFKRWKLRVKKEFNFDGSYEDYTRYQNGLLAFEWEDDKPK